MDNIEKIVDKLFTNGSGQKADRLVLDNVDTFRLERMGDDHVWGAVHLHDGSRIVFNLFAGTNWLSLTHECDTPPAALPALVERGRDQQKGQHDEASREVLGDVAAGAPVGGVLDTRRGHEADRGVCSGTTPEAPVSPAVERGRDAQPAIRNRQSSRNEWRMDDRGLLDDVVVDNVDTFRLERMGDDHVWGAVHLHDGSRIVFNLFAGTNWLSLTHEFDTPPVALPAHIERGRDEELKALVDKWRAISNDAKPSADCDLDMVVMARDGQYAETLAICADQLEAALRSPSADGEKK